jgi:hypothetical protein
MSQNTWRHFLNILILIVILSSFLAPRNRQTTYAAPIVGVTERVSVTSSGEQGGGPNENPSISANGRYVVFNSHASDLIIGDNNNYGDVFVHDRMTGLIECVSVSSNGDQGNNSSYWASISDNGRFVAFASDASNLINEDTNGRTDIYIRDRQNGTTERVSVSSNGEEANEYSQTPVISSDGNYVVFGSLASNLVSGDNNEKKDIFIRELITGETELVSVSNSGSQGNHHSYSPSVADDGRFVTFESYASNLVNDDTNLVRDVFFKDRQTGVLERVSVSSSHEQGNNSSHHPFISPDGRFITFGSNASNLVIGDNNELHDIFVRDRQQDEIELVSVSSTGEQGNDDAYISTISPNGNFVVFTSYASNLVSGDTNEARDVFLKDRRTGDIEIVSVSSIGEQSNDASNGKFFSSDGRFIVFDSYGSNLVSGDTNGKRDVFVRDRCPDGTCGENPCELNNIPLYYQGWPSTPDSLPNKPDWFNDVYGNYPDGDTYNTVGRWGCNTTSNAMIVDFYLQCNDFTYNTNPGDLNSWLRNGGYNSNHGVIYSKVVQYAKTLGIGLKISIESRDDQKMNQHLVSGNPAMVMVKTLYGTHFVTVKGRTQINATDTYLINDPIWGATTLYEHYNNTYSKAYYYTGSTSTTNLSHLQISALSPVHLVITDSLGRKSGYDPRTDTTWDEIPNAGYTTEDIAEPDGDTLGDTKILLITHPMEGEYDIEVIGFDDGDYKVEVVKLNNFGDSSEEVFSGKASEGSSDTFSIEYDPGGILYLPFVQK